MAKKGGRLPHDDRAWAKAFQNETAVGKFVAIVQDKLRILLGHLDDFGNEKKLPGDAASRERGFQLLVDDAFMGGVLVHQDHAVGGLRKDVRLVKLRAGGAKPFLGLFFGRAVGRSEWRGRFFCKAVGGGGAEGPPWRAKRGAVLLDIGLLHSGRRGAAAEWPWGNRRARTQRLP